MCTAEGSNTCIYTQIQNCKGSRRESAGVGVLDPLLSRIVHFAVLMEAASLSCHPTYTSSITPMNEKVHICFHRAQKRARDSTSLLLSYSKNMAILCSF